MKILKANDQPTVRGRGGYRRFVTYEMRERWGCVPTWEVDPNAPPVYAWINQGNWAADCECRGSLVVQPGEPYICPDCGNAKFGGRARKVIFPKDSDKAEKILLKRPYPKNRNWLVGETIEKLRIENMAHGLEAE